MRNWCDPINLIFTLLILFGYITNGTVGKNKLKVSLVETVSETKKVISSLFVWSFDGHVQAINRFTFDSTRECVIRKKKLSSKKKTFHQSIS